MRSGIVNISINPINVSVLRLELWFQFQSIKKIETYEEEEIIYQLATVVTIRSILPRSTSSAFVSDDDEETNDKS